ncbi:SPOR domain-containing protein [Falsiroseomonas sp. HW251]|uniref:SPOR domain-containing protein n=1 Tax=Falsiroseomonas sp. HW251 TaxID=3390998 RepID=UPI003D31BA42
MRTTPSRRAAQAAPPLRAAMLGSLAALAACADGSAIPGQGAGASQAQRQAFTVSGTATLADPGLAAIRRSAAAAPNDLNAQARFAAALARAGEPAMAEQVIVAALLRSPDHPALTRELARLRLRGGQPQVALALFDQAARIEPGAEAEEGRGLALDMIGRHDEAQAAYRAALALAPNRVAVQNNLAMSLILTGRVQEALAVLEPLSQRPDAPARVANNLAIARSMAGDARPVAIAGDPAELRQAASSLRATLGVAPAQPAPAGAFAAAEPGRGADTTPLFPLDTGRGAATAASAGWPLAPQPPRLLAQATPEERELLPAGLPPRQPILLPPPTELSSPLATSVAPLPVRPVPSAFPPREPVGSMAAAPDTVPAVSVIPVPASPAPPPVIALPAVPTPAAAPALPPTAEPGLALAPAVPAAAPAPAARRTAEAAGFAPMVVTALLIPQPSAAAARIPAAERQAPVATDAPPAPPVVVPAVARPAPMASGMLVTSVVLPAARAAEPDAEPRPARTEAAGAPRGTSFVVQVGALPTESAARVYWSSLRSQLPGQFDGRDPILAHAELPKGTFWRLRTGGFETPADAQGFCQVLRGHGRDCWVPPN